MPVSGPGGPGGGSGGSLNLGPATNTFNGADRSAAEAARNAYATANAAWLAQYDAEPTYTIILTYGTTTVYQSRRGNAWADVTGLIRGPGGPVGPQGVKGDKGDKGDTGETGPQGIQGIAGARGEKGDKGDKGDTGDTGPQGKQGDTGPRGAAGSGASVAVSDEGTQLTTAVTSLDFRGTGVVVTESTEGVLTVTIAGGGGASDPGTHNRLIGWSAGAVPTSAEIFAATIVADGNTLTIPSRTAGQDGHIFFGVPADPGLPDELYFSNNPSLNQAAFFTERTEANNGDFTRNNVTYLIMSTDNALFAATYGTGSITLRLVYS